MLSSKFCPKLFFPVRRYVSSSSVVLGKVLAIRREDNSIWERRAPLSPSHVESLVQDGVKVLVQPSNRRSYSMRDYEKKGAIIKEDISEASTILGVKRPKVEDLIPDKTYVIFSHTIKGQAENLDLLTAVLEKRIRLVDYECIVDENNRRIVAFGKYAGVCGMINIIHGLGMRLLALGHHTPFMHVGTAHNYITLEAAKKAIFSLGREIQDSLMPESLGPIIFTFTGSGNVSQGAQEIFQQLPHEYVSPDSLKDVVENGDIRKVYGTVVSRKDHLVRKDDGSYSVEDYSANPQDYKSVFFEKIVPYSTCIVNGVFWAPGLPQLISKEQSHFLHPRAESFNASDFLYEGRPKLPQRLLAIADISNDLHGSFDIINFNTTIDNPFVIYDVHKDTSSYDMMANGILFMVIENLPAQLPCVATDYFGSKLLPLIHDFMKFDCKKSMDECEVSVTAKNSLIAYNGQLTSRFHYLEDFVQ